MKGHTNPNDSHNYHDENHDEIEFYQRNSDRSSTQHNNNTRPKKTSPIDCNGVLLTNVQCHMVPISILWYREYWTIQLKCTPEARQEIVTVSNHPIHQHGHTNFCHVFISIIKIASIMYGMYLISGIHGPEPRSSGGNIIFTIIFPKVLTLLYPVQPEILVVVYQNLNVVQMLRRKTKWHISPIQNYMQYCLFHI